MFEEDYNRDKTQWRSADGRSIVIKDLEASHLVNILNWIRKNKSNYSPGIYSFLEEEAKLRRLLAFTTNEPMPKKMNDGWYTLENLSKTRKLWFKVRKLYYDFKLKNFTSP